MRPRTTYHTMLARVAYRSNEAHFVAGHESIFKTPAFVNDRIRAFPIGTYVVIKFTQTASRRYLTTIDTLKNVVEAATVSGGWLRSHSLPEYAKMIGDPAFRSSESEVAVISFLATRFQTLLTEGTQYEGAHGPSAMRFTASSALISFATNIEPAVIDMIDHIYRGAPKEMVDSMTMKFSRAYSHRATATATPSPDDILSAVAATVEVMAAEQADSTVWVEPKTESMPVINLSGAKWIEGIYIKNRDLAIFETMKSLRDDETANILMVGPSGCGKTSIPAAYAKYADMDVIRMNCAAVRDPEEWFGYREAVEGSTEFIPTEFTKKVRQGNTIIILDEFNRVEPWLHNTLLPLLDHDRRTIVHNEEIKCGPKTVFVATMNIGANFTGTFMLDAAILNRFDAVINVETLTPAVEVKLLVDRTGITNDTAGMIVRILNKLRSNDDIKESGVDVSARSALKVAKLVAGGLIDIRTSVGYVVLNLIEDPSVLKSANDLIISEM